MKYKIILTCFALIIIGYFLAFGTDYIYGLIYPKNRILVCITSFKRPLLLSGQIIRFQNQTYSNFDISVSVKGAPQEMVRATFMQEWQPLMEKGRLSVRFDENRGQLSNFLDTVRDKDLSQYDYFCKVDDDDWYAPTYLEQVNDYLVREPGVMMSETTRTVFLNDGDDSVKMGYYHGVLSGPTMCMSRRLIEMMLALEKDASALEPMFPAHQVRLLKNCCEDRLFNEVAETFSKLQYRNTVPTSVVYGRQYPSITRNNGYLK